MPRKRRRLNLSPIDRQSAKLISRAWAVFGVALTLSLLMQLFVTPNGKFFYDNNMFFHAVYGLLSCAVIIGISCILGLLLKRKERYYDKEEEE